jgi:predicted ribosomally synthesized peptide with SipW-like signal peptide
MSTPQKLLLSLVVLAGAGIVGGLATFSAFSSTTTNSGNSFAAGTVYISDNDAGSAMYSVSNKKPGDTAQDCIKLTYTGSLPATVKLYTTSSIGTLGQYIDMTVEKGTQSGSPTFPSCTGFTPDSSGTIYSGTLSNFASTKTAFSNGVSAFPGSQTQWNQNDTLVYRITLTLQDNNAANGGGSGPLSTGSHAFTWEAQNQ